MKKRTFAGVCIKPPKSAHCPLPVRCSTDVQWSTPVLGRSTGSFRPGPEFGSCDQSCRDLSSVDSQDSAFGCPGCREGHRPDHLMTKCFTYYGVGFLVCEKACLHKAVSSRSPHAKSMYTEICVHACRQEVSMAMPRESYSVLPYTQNAGRNVVLESNPCLEPLSSAGQSRRPLLRSLASKYWCSTSICLMFFSFSFKKKCFPLLVLKGVQRY